MQDTTALRAVMARVRRRTESVERRMALTHMGQALRWLEADAAVVKAQGHDNERDGACQDGV